MNKLILLFFIISLSACDSDSNNETPAPKNEHIWKHQTDALKQAEDLAEQLEEQFKKKMEQMEKNQE